VDIKPIKNRKDHENALKRIAELWNARPKTREGDELDILTTLAVAYEEKNAPIDEPNPIDAIKFRMDQLGLKDRDLVPFIGARSKVSEVLNYKRGLSLPMIRRLAEGLDIPAETLIQRYRVSSQA
jgi:HTH-type transcriptional regulator/antitoxin HigA